MTAGSGVGSPSRTAAVSLYRLRETSIFRGTVGAIVAVQQGMAAMMSVVWKPYREIDNTY